MLKETGVGSGRVWPERKLCATVAEAEAIARAEVDELEAKDKEDREQRRQSNRNDIYYLRQRATRLRDEMAKVILNLTGQCNRAPADPLDQKLRKRAERVLKRNADFTDPS